MTDLVGAVPPVRGEEIRREREPHVFRQRREDGPALAEFLPRPLEGREGAVGVMDERARLLPEEQHLHPDMVVVVEIRRVLGDVVGDPVNLAVLDRVARDVEVVHAAVKHAGAADLVAQLGRGAELDGLHAVFRLLLHDGFLGLDLGDDDRGLAGGQRMLGDKVLEPLGLGRAEFRHREQVLLPVGVEQPDIAALDARSGQALEAWVRLGALLGLRRALGLGRLGWRDGRGRFRRRGLGLLLLLAAAGEQEGKAQETGEGEETRGSHISRPARREHQQ